MIVAVISIVGEFFSVDEKMRQYSTNISCRNLGNRK